MPDTPPDRLSIHPGHPDHDAAVLDRGVGIRFNGQERTNIVEYCVSEGWVKMAVGKALDRHGNAMAMKVNGVVEPYFLDAPGADDDAAG